MTTSEPASGQPPFPSRAGVLYAIGGAIAGLIAFAPAALLASLMMGCGGDTGVCEATGSGLVGILVAIAVFLIPLTGGFASALRGGDRGLIAGTSIGFAVMALEWIVVLGMG